MQTRTDYRIPLYYGVTTLYWFSMYTYVPTFSPYMKSLGISLKMIGVIVGSYGFTQMLLRIPLGVISDSIRKRKVFVQLGMFLGFVSSLGLYLARDPASLLISRGLAGCAAAAWVTLTVLFCSYFDDARAPHALGVLNAWNSLGQMSGMFLGGVVAEKFGQTAPFLLGAVGGAAATVGSFGLVENAPANPRRQTMGQLLSVGMNANLLLISGLAVLSQILTFGALYGFTPIAARAIGATSFQLGMMQTISTAPMIVASALSGSFFAKRLGERMTVTLGFLIFAFACASVPLVKTMPMLYATQLVGGFGRGLVFPTLMALSIRTTPAERRASAMGFYQAIYGIGMSFGPVLVGLVADSLGLDAGFYATGLVGLVGAALAFGMIGARSANSTHKEVAL